MVSFRNVATCAAPTSVSPPFWPKFSVSKFAQNETIRPAPTSVTFPPHISRDFKCRRLRNARIPLSLTLAANKSRVSRNSSSGIAASTPRSVTKRESRERYRRDVHCFKYPAPSSSTRVCPKSRWKSSFPQTPRTRFSKPSFPTSVSANVTLRRLGSFPSHRAATSPIGHESRFSAFKLCNPQSAFTPSSFISVNARFNPVSDPAKFGFAMAAAHRPVTAVASKDNVRRLGRTCASSFFSQKSVEPPSSPPVFIPSTSFCTTRVSVNTPIAKSSNFVPVRSKVCNFFKNRSADAARGPALVLASTSVFKPTSDFRETTSISLTRLHHPRFRVSREVRLARQGTPPAGGAFLFREFLRSRFCFFARRVSESSSSSEPRSSDDVVCEAGSSWNTSLATLFRCAQRSRDRNVRCFKPFACRNPWPVIGVPSSFRDCRFGARGNTWRASSVTPGHSDKSSAVRFGNEKKLKRFAPSAVSFAHRANVSASSDAAFCASKVCTTSSSTESPIIARSRNQRYLNCSASVTPPNGRLFVLTRASNTIWDKSGGRRAIR
mmetsp:Transcript_787/g.3030  ORF Transcript_787/g.3030 Transcript_787/m.3030 type:complete len:550 (-) Transcript_787:443-2092(-)